MRRSTTSNDGRFRTNLRGFAPFASTALVAACATLVGCGGDGSTARVFDTLSYDAGASAQQRTVGPEEELAAAAARIRPLLAKQSRRKLTGREQRAFASGELEIERTHAALRRQFAADHKKLSGLGADGAVSRLERVQRATAESQSAWAAAVGELSSGERSRTAVVAAQSALNALAPEPSPQSTSSAGAFGTPDPVPASPVLSAGITPAYSAPIANAAGSSLPRVPEAEDLAATPETVVTPAISTLAQQLDRDAVKIYAYVRDNIAYEPYYGIRKGADVTLKQKAGSDADQASLTIALLRASGVPARFVRGTVELPADNAANWLGVNTAAGEDVAAGPDILASGGVPTTALKVNGQLSAVRFDHVWTEAYVAASAYRGIDEHAGDRAWVPLDPSVKLNVFTAPSVDLRTLMEPIAEQWALDYDAKSAAIASSTLLPPTADEAVQATSDLISRSRAAIAGQGGVENLEDMVGSKQIRASEAAYLPGSLPFRTKSVAAEWRTIPSSLSADVSISVAGASALSLPAAADDTEGTLQFTAKTHDLAEKRITLAYVPASVADADVIDAYHGLLHAPAYAAQLTPVLRVDGRVVARGSTPVPVGYAQRFTVTYRSPGFASDHVDNPVVVGSLSALVLTVGPPSAEGLKARAARLQQLAPTTTTETLLTDARVGELLAELGGYYFLRNDAFNAFASQAAGVSAVRALSGAIVATDLGMTYVAGFPVRARLAGLFIDVDEDVQAVVAKTSTEPLADAFVRASASYASSSEGEIFNNFFEADTAVSTVSVFEAAAEQRIPLVEIDANNVAQIDSLLTVAQGVKSNIVGAVADGAAQVLIPQRAVQIGSWTGSGYVVDYGRSFDYRISGGRSGGSFGGPPNEDYYALIEEALKSPPLEGKDALTERIHKIFDVFLNSVAPFVKESEECYNQYAYSKEALAYTEEVSAMVMGLILASHGKLPKAPALEGKQLKLAFKAGAIGALFTASGTYAGRVAVAVLECGA